MCLTHIAAYVNGKLCASDGTINDLLVGATRAGEASRLARRLSSRGGECPAVDQRSARPRTAMIVRPSSRDSRLTGHCAGGTVCRLLLLLDPFAGQPVPDEAMRLAVGPVAPISPPISGGGERVERVFA
jgi:hypothetical protein